MASTETLSLDTKVLAITIADSFSVWIKFVLHIFFPYAYNDSILIGVSVLKGYEIFLICSYLQLLYRQLLSLNLITLIIVL